MKKDEPRLTMARGGLALRAYHEAGHVIVGHELGAKLGSASIRTDAFGYPGGHALVDMPWWKGEKTLPEDLPRSAMVNLAGLAAEAIVWGCVNYHPGDMDTDTAIRRGVRLATALSASGYAGGPVSDLEKAAQCLPYELATGEACDAWLEERALEAGRLLQSRWQAVEAIRRALMRRQSAGTLTGEQLVALIDPTQTGSTRS